MPTDLAGVVTFMRRQNMELRVLTVYQYEGESK